ncbi:MAG: DNA-directed RNA polymerase [Nanoarchaeota archaeon]|nr:DNA-directed RNA polymerase [Nanoarchaeota archaeon]
MYSILELKSNIRVPPQFLGKKLKEAIKSAIEKEYIGALGKHGLFLAILDVKEIGEGTIIPGDGAVYYETTFEALVYRPILQEVVEGFVSEIMEFGAFIRIGPIDGLVHVSQVMDDYVNYSEAGALQGKESKKVLKVKDKVRARIIAISLKNLRGAKLGLTMRQPGLGKIEWIEAEKKKETEETKEKKEKKQTKKKKKK